MKLRKILIFVLFMFASVFALNLSVNAATNVTLDLSAQGYANAYDLDEKSLANGPVKIAFAKNTGSNGPKYYTSGTAVRVYSKNTVTISGTDVVITKIVITFGSGDGSNPISVNGGTFDTNTWTGSASSVVFTIGGTSGNRRFKSVTITYEDVQSVTPMQKFEGVATNASLLANYVVSGTELYNYELTEQIFTYDSNTATANETATLNGITWTGSTATYYGYDSSNGRGMQISKKNVEMPLYTITSTESFENVKYVKINAAGNSGTDATVKVTIGGTQIGATAELTNVAKDYEFVSAEALSGVMVITYEQTTTQAVYFKSVKVMNETPAYTMDTAALRFGVAEMTADLYDELVAAGTNVEFGVAYIKDTDLEGTFEEAITNGDVIKVACTPALNGETYQFALVLTNIPAFDFDKEVTAAAYVCVDGTYYYATETTYSVNTIATEYVTNQASNAAVKEHLGMLNWLQTYVGE